MLKLNNIVKEYPGATTVEALKGVSIAFRPSEFVAVLGHSGCGKTTLLNIIGGLDRYTSGDLIIRGRSTKEFKARDWDTYRNHSVGFVFQSYNLIPHQSVLANVELALTLSGIKRAERRRRATEALEQVGLGDQLHKKPNQLSGGQMQRVAIARALVNDPEILLADEPTGALDTETSVQVMEILKEVAKDRLVIMVTHNPELADKYATRIVKLTDGRIVADSDPYEGSKEPLPEAKTKKGKKASMSLLTAFMLSLSNLMTKKGRTVMTAFAGSIGIIGIALIFSISTGINNYIEKVEKDTLSNYPLTLEATTMDMGSMMNTISQMNQSIEYTDDKVYSVNVMSGMMDVMFVGATENNLTDFKAYVDSGKSGLEDLTTEIRYVYSTPLNIYKADTENGIYRVNPSSVMEQMPLPATPPISMDVFYQMSSNKELLDMQYEVLDGDLPKAWNEVVLIVDENNCVTDYTLYSLGILDVDPLIQATHDKMAGKDVRLDTTTHIFDFHELIGTKYKILPTTSYYQQQPDGSWIDKREDPVYMASALQTAEELTVVGVVKVSGEASSTVTAGVIGYRGDLMAHVIQAVNESPIVKAQKEKPEWDVINNLPFADPETEPKTMTLDEIMAALPTMPEETAAELMGYVESLRASGMSDEQIAATLSSYFPSNSSSTYEGNLTLLGVSDPERPTAINLYPKDFEAKDQIADVIADYNAGKEDADQITYTDYVGLMMSSITTIINAISYILIAFVGISLVVSSIMIGIITNISVLERTKEIGILRAVGASKKDIRHVFNAETMIVGLAAGLVGIGLTELLIIPINALIQNVAGLDAEAVLGLVPAVILILISVLLTAVAGLIPAGNAAKKDPVVALRTE